MLLCTSKLILLVSGVPNKNRFRIKIVSGAKIGGYKNSELSELNLENVEKIINKNSVEYNLIKPIYLS